MSIAGRNFFITGAASGLGEACLRRFVAAGARVTAIDLNQAAAQRLTDELGGEPGGAVLPLVVDVTREDQVRDALDRAIRTFGPLFGVVQCAGILAAARLAGKEGPHSLDLFRRVIDVNLIGTFNVMRLASAAMTGNDPDTEGERGVIVNTSSVAAFEGQIGQTAYAASKGAVASMTLPAARELARFGIRVAAIAPGVFETPMMGMLPAEGLAALAAQSQYPPRLGRPDEFAQLAEQIFVNRMLNGCVLRLDAGARLSAK